MQFLAVAGRILIHTLIGMLALPLAAFIFAMIVYVLDSRCGTPGDSGGCEMGLGMIVFMAVPAGAGLGFLVGVWRVVRARMAPPS